MFFLKGITNGQVQDDVVDAPDPVLVELKDEPLALRKRRIVDLDARIEPQQQEGEIKSRPDTCSDRYFPVKVAEAESCTRTLCIR